MSEMVERVARAMEPEVWDSTAMKRSEEAGFAREHAVMMANSLRRARASIEAMREPTQAMHDAAVQSFLIDAKTQQSAEKPEITVTLGGMIDQSWRAMIDEALK